MSEERFMVTGAMGCIGAWVVRNLVKEGVQTAVYDLSDNNLRMRLLMSEEEISKVQFIRGSVADLDAVKQALADCQASHVIHLAALQIPFCKADPSLGSQVNVVGTVNMFEAIRHAGGQVRGFCFASSAAAYGPDTFYPEKPVPEEASLKPNTLYGVYKQANENTARVYWQDWQVSSVCLRPHTIYGVARDQGMTSDLAKAVLAAAAKRPFHIKFSGPTCLQYTDDAARMFIGAARAGYEGALVCNMRNDVVEVAEYVKILKEVVPGAQVTYEESNVMPFPADVSDENLRSVLPSVPHTPMKEAIGQMVPQYEDLLSRGLVDLNQLEA